MVEVSKDNEDDEVWLHFVVLPHLVEDHWDTLGVTNTTFSLLFLYLQL
ncbi:hypothetical protein ID866_12733 [Astraeus odoratus]|nr:hypothetical protein ID866_12733 [Astraeus odoratus]